MEGRRWSTPEFVELDPDAYEPSAEQLARFELLGRLAESFEAHHVSYSIIGGYGLDALYGKLTRDHEDIDVLVRAGSEDAARRVILDAGFTLERVKEWKIEVYQHSPTVTRLELALSTWDNFPKEADLNAFFPASPNGQIGNIRLRTHTLEAEEIVATLQAKKASELAWGEYKHAPTRSLLVQRIRKKLAEEK